MTVTVTNFKGGVGKTSISFNLALELGLSVVENDPAGAMRDLMYPHRKTTTVHHVEPEAAAIPVRPGTLYDFGGFQDHRTFPVIAASDVVVVPTLYSYMDLKASIRSMGKILEYNENLILVINRVNASHRFAFSDMVRLVKSYFGSRPIFVLKLPESKGMINSTNRSRSIRSLAEESALSRKNYAGLMGDFDELVKTVEVFRPAVSGSR